MYAATHSLSSVLQDYAQRIPKEWLVGILLLISMMLQLVLVVLGARRYHSSGAILSFVVWGAYISADAVAISALGYMMHSARDGIYGIWAPVILLHLGGPDAITAYSTTDNELWMRHGFNMVYQVSVSVYVIHSAALESHALASAILLLVAGATKYGERTIALWFGSDFQIFRSCLPISKYVKERKLVQDHGYVVMGEKQIHKITERGLGVSSTEGKDIEAQKKAPQLEGKDIEAQKKAPQLEGRGIVTIKDVEGANVNEVDRNLCISHALFKMYMRRFVSLHFDEGDWKETRDLWAKFGGKKAFRIVETELKFMYDVLFSKGSGTAFSNFGIVLRLLNCVLMGAAGFLILRERQQGEAQRVVTYAVISVALVVEVYQLCRIMTSDWTRVRLICAQVEEITHLRSQKAAKWPRICRSKLINISVLVLGKVQNVVGGDRYWTNEIHQHCLVETCLERSRFVWKMSKFFPEADSYIASWHIQKVCVQEELKDFIFDILKRKCSPEDDSGTCRDKIYYFDEDLLEQESDIRDVVPPHENLEAVILVWHIATTICERVPPIMIENGNLHARLSRILSRYCAYLLVSRPRLLPVHPDMARITYTQLVEQLMGKVCCGENLINLSDCSDQSLLGSGEELARKLLAKEEKDRWNLLAEYWAGLVIYMAVYNKAKFHAECVARGGELLSQVWVLLGHMGCGEQSDSAVRKKIESSPEGERRERGRIKREREQQERKREERDREREERDREREREQRERLEWERERLDWELKRLEREQELRGRLDREVKRLEQERQALERDKRARERARERSEKERPEGQHMVRHPIEPEPVLVECELEHVSQNLKSLEGLQKDYAEWDRLLQGLESLKQVYKERERPKTGERGTWI